MDRMRNCIRRAVNKVAEDKNVESYRALYAEQFGMFVHLATKSRQTRSSQRMLERVLMNGLKQLEERIVTILLDSSRDGSYDVTGRVNHLQNKLLYCEDFLMQRFRDELYTEDTQTDSSQADDMSPYLLPVVSESRRGEILRGALEEHHEDLVAVLDTDHTRLLDILTTSSILTESDEDDIRSGSTRTERNRRVMNVLKTSSPSKTESTFLSFLHAHHVQEARMLQRTMKALERRPLTHVCAACAVRTDVDLSRIAKTLFRRRAIQRGEYLDLCNPAIPSEEKWNLVMKNGLEAAVINSLAPKFAHYYDRFRGMTDLECRCDEISEPPSTVSDLSLLDQSDIFGNTDPEKEEQIHASDKLSNRNSSVSQCSRSSSFQNATEHERHRESKGDDYDTLKQKLSDLCTKVDTLLDHKDRHHEERKPTQMNSHHRNKPNNKDILSSQDDARKCICCGQGQGLCLCTGSVDYDRQRSTESNNTELPKRSEYCHPTIPGSASLKIPHYTALEGSHFVKASPEPKAQPSNGNRNQNQKEMEDDEASRYQTWI